MDIPVQTHRAHCSMGMNGLGLERWVVLWLLQQLRHHSLAVLVEGSGLGAHEVIGRMLRSPHSSYCIQPW